MKSWIAVFVAWAIILQSSVWAEPFSLDLTTVTETDYSTFLANIRTNVRDPKLVYGGTDIPVMGNNPKTEFLRINLIVSTGTVSIAVRRSDLYVVAYLIATKNKTKFRAYYMSKLITSDQVDKLFAEKKGGKVDKQTITEYDETYTEIENVARVNRKQAGLGIKRFVEYIEGVNKVPRNVNDEAKFILLAIQMVSEATRSRYIENAVLEHFPNAFTPDDHVIITERNWDRISEAIKRSDHGVFPAPIELDCDCKYVKDTWVVKKAAQLNMGLLKYLGKNALSRSLKIITVVVVVVVLVLFVLYLVRVTLPKSHKVKKPIKSG